MTGYKPYQQTNLLGLEYLPSKWEVKKIKHLFSLGRGRVISQEELEEDGVYPVYSSQTNNNGCLGHINTYDFDCKQITWTTDGANAGTVFLREGKHNCTNVCGTLYTDSIRVSLPFFLYCLKYVTQFHKRPDTNGAKIMNNEMAEICIPSPSYREQLQISSFLDHQTAKINTLIDKQQQLIELLKEKRQAVISHAVTKGLNPDVPMKDSGVEWLGEVPEHWDTLAISHLFTRIKRTGYNDKELLSVYRDYGVIPKSSRDDNNNKPSEDLSPYQLVKPNDLVMNKMKAWQGSIAISECEGIVSPAYFVYTPKDKLFELALPKYVHYLLRNSLYVTQYLSRSKGIRINQWDLDPDEFRCIELLLPTKEEQLRIFRFLDYTTTTIDTLIEKQRQQIELLKERRTALISAAVTGKIDVRDWTAPAPQQPKIEMAEEALA